MILITVASGSVGGAVLEAVRKTGHPFKAMYRSAEEAGKAPAGVATVVADFSSPETLAKALAGIETVFLVCSPIPQLVELESNVIDAAVKTGARHIVLNSALGAGDYPKSFPSWHRIVESKLQASGLGYTILRPNGFMQNILAYNAPSIRAQGAFYAAMGRARTSFIDVRDIATVTAKILCAPQDHNGRTYELNGPEAVTYGELAERISRVAGRQVNFVDIPESAQRDAMLGMGMPQWQVDALLDLQRYYTGGQGGEVDGVLEGLLGNPPEKLDAFLQEFRHHFLSQAANA